MPVLYLETSALDMLIAGLEAVMTEHGCTLCAAAWTPLLAKLKEARNAKESDEQEPPAEPATENPSAEQEPIAKPKFQPWSKAEDSIIRKYADAGKDRWAKMREALPKRTNSMIKSRYGRLGLRTGTDIAEHSVNVHEHQGPEPTVEPPVAASADPMPLPTTEDDDDDGWSWTTRGPSKDRLMSGR